MLRPCLDCGYRSEPREGGRCPECGSLSLPPTWVVIEMNLPRKAKILLVSLAIAGLAVPLFMVAIGIVLGANTLGAGCFGFFPILFVPFLLRSLFSRRAMGMFIITDSAIELRGSHATTSFRASEGWGVGSLRRDVGSQHHWLLDLHQRAPGHSRTEIPIDDRLDDPKLVEAAARRALGSPTATDVT